MAVAQLAILVAVAHHAATVVQHAVTVAHHAVVAPDILGLTTPAQAHGVGRQMALHGKIGSTLSRMMDSEPGQDSILQTSGAIFNLPNECNLWNILIQQVKK